MSNRPTRIRNYARWAAGLAAAGVLMYMSFLSLQENVHLRVEVMLGLLALVIVLLYGVDAFVEVIEAWRGGGGGD